MHAHNSPERAVHDDGRARGWRAHLRAWLAFLNGDAAYAGYLAHQRAHHPDTPPLSRAAFHRAETDRRWNGVRRCC